MTQKAFKYRFYPTPEQESLLRRTMGCTRLVYNLALAYRTQAWYEDKKRVGYGDTSDLLTQWKKEDDLQFLNEVSCVPLQQGLRHLQKAFSNFFAKRAAYPNFKKKRNGGSAEFTKSAFKFKDGQVYLAKCSEQLPIATNDRDRTSNAIVKTSNTNDATTCRWWRERCDFRCEIEPAGCTVCRWSGCVDTRIIQEVGYLRQRYLFLKLFRHRSGKM